MLMMTFESICAHLVKWKMNILQMIWLFILKKRAEKFSYD